MKWLDKYLRRPRALPASRTRHKQRIHELVTRHADRIHKRIRPHFVKELADRILKYEPDAESFEQLDETEMLATLVVHVLSICREIDEQDRRAHEGFEAFTGAYYRMRTDNARLRLLREYLEQTVTDPKKRRGDIAATSKFLDLDVLMERHTRARQRRSCAIEVALGFVGGALGVLTDPQALGERPLPSMLMTGKVVHKLGLYIESGGRWQNRLAALRALATMYVNLNSLGQINATDITSLRRIVSFAENPRENPWLQIAASRVLLILEPREREAILYRRLVDLTGKRPRTDFLVRRNLIDTLLDFMSKRDVFQLLKTLIAGEDPSEHARMGIPYVLARIADEEAFNEMLTLLRKERASPNGSARVRASCAIAAAGAVDTIMQDPDEGMLILPSAFYIIQTLIETDADKFVLEVASEEAVVFWENVLKTDVADMFEGIFIPPLQRALLARRTDESLRPAAHEAMSSAAEKLERMTSSARAQWTDYLGETALTIRPGDSLTLSLDNRPDHLPSMPESPTWLGRILAELSRRDWGISASRQGNKLTLWRGDHFKRRAWRIIHEITHPAPNKRQAFYHTTGRTQRGNIRAHPGILDEVTATTVPGERVVVDTEGSWGRHVPLVDDLLDLPLFSSKPVQLFSSHGLINIRPPEKFLSRVRNRIKITFQYRKLSNMRFASLRATEPQERRNYLESVNNEYGIGFDYEPYEYTNIAPSEPDASPYVQSLMPKPPEPKPVLAAAATPAVTSDSTAMLAGVPFFSDFKLWLDDKLPYFLDPTANSQASLAIFAGALAGLTFLTSFYKRTSITRARNSVPLSIGGWGTRGKSGTERIKAGLFAGMGYHTFSKTTGCEAMFINALPGQTSLEVFIYRPYNKATIWEQSAMIKLAADVGAEVFLWECMALNPIYVQLLQHVWMRDDLVTLTNAFPDHEDIQGPAGMDVARVISSFIGPGRALFTTETNFLPLFRDRCEQLDAEFYPVPVRDADLIADDMLALYPYAEHPRNIALCAHMAEYLGIDGTFAMVMMAENVVADLGVLKTYPEIRVRGRVMAFVNGMSANERAGCLNNWRRMECDKLDIEIDPDKGVVTVVNNRDDRISRSDVFAKIMVQDLIVERHVVIGTNQRGLATFINNALDVFVPTLAVLEEGADEPTILKRLAGHMARLRIPLPDTTTLLARLEQYASGADMAIADESRDRIAARMTELLEPSTTASIAVAEIRSELAGDKALAELIKLALVESNEPSRVPEIIEPTTIEEIYEHFLYSLARIVVHARLRARASEAAKNTSGNIDSFHKLFWDAYRELYLELIVWVENAGATGDQVVDQAISASAPGCNNILLGIQNIKGTGLDFVYRWVALGKVDELVTDLEDEDKGKREAALRELEAFGDHGMVDSGYARMKLARMSTSHFTESEHKQFERVQLRLDKVFKEKLGGLAQTGGHSFSDSFFTWLEGWFDNLDSIRRFQQSNRVNREIVHHRISLARAAIEMREIYARQKGGWLAKLIKKRKK